MIDALGNPQSVLVVGGTSDIALATVRRLGAGGRLRRVVLAGRRPDALDGAGADLRALLPSGADVSTGHIEAADPVGIGGAVDAAFAAGDVDVVLVALGTLPDQARALDDVAEAVRTAQVNYVAGTAACIAAAAGLRAQGHGNLVVLSTVAAQRPRRSNFVYGSAKAGLDALARGLMDDLHGSGAAVVLVRPGFVHSAMTRGLEPAPLATTPDVVAEAIAGALGRGSRTVWVPRALRPVMAVLGAVPRPLFRRLPV